MMMMVAGDVGGVGGEVASVNGGGWGLVNGSDDHCSLQLAI